MHTEHVSHSGPSCVLEASLSQCPLTLRDMSSNQKSSPATERSPEINTSDGWTSDGYARADTESSVESEVTQGWRACSLGGDESAGASVDGPPVCSVKAIVVQSGEHPEAAAGSIQVTPLHAQGATIMLPRRARRRRRQRKRGLQQRLYSSTC